MDKFFRRHDAESQKTGSFPVTPHIFESALHWLTGLVQLTEEEQKEAGIYFDDMPVNTSQQETHDS